MNLIEQFGSYNKTKSEYEKAKDAGFRKDVVFAFEKALLQYRREHNIFEVGDKVVFDATFCDGSDNVGFGEITYISNDKKVYEIDNYYIISFGEFRHATDAEILAERRL